MDFLWASEDLTRSDVVRLINPHFLKNKVAPVYFKDPKDSTSDTTIVDPDEANCMADRVRVRVEYKYFRAGSTF